MIVPMRAKQTSTVAAQSMHPAAMTLAPSSRHLHVVLDTNVVLDWLVFDDRSTLALREAVADGTLVVLTDSGALTELERVLNYAQLDLNDDDKIRVLTTYQAVASPADAMDPPCLPHGFPRCRDRDDDHFIELAYRTKADALVSKDKAVLKLRKRAAKFGVRILDSRQLADLLHAEGVR
jgi:putative PIN family toxin of toxin-antitoxin system